MATIISCFTNSFGRFGARTAIEQLGSTGLKHMELPVRTAGRESIFGDSPLFTHESTEAELQNVDQLLAEHGVQVASCNIMSGNPLAPEVLALTRHKLDLAARFEVPVVVCDAGEADDPADRRRLYRHLHELGDHADSLNIDCCFETHPGLCVDERGMLQTMQDLAHPRLKLNFDTANILYYNRHITGEIALAKVCQHVRHVHLKDSAGEYRQWYFPALGQGGAVDFVRVLELLRVCGFRGPYSIELEGIEGEPELSLEQTTARITDSVQYLRQCGYFDDVTE